MTKLLPSITDVECTCRVCHWHGIVGNCIPDIDGDGNLGCPNCDAVITVVGPIPAVVIDTWRNEYSLITPLPIRCPHCSKYVEHITPVEKYELTDHQSVVKAIYDPPTLKCPDKLGCGWSAVVEEMINDSIQGWTVRYRVGDQTTTWKSQ